MKKAFYLCFIINTKNTYKMNTQNKGTWTVDCFDFDYYEAHVVCGVYDKLDTTSTHLVEKLVSFEDLEAYLGGTRTFREEAPFSEFLQTETYGTIERTLADIINGKNKNI